MSKGVVWALSWVPVAVTFTQTVGQLTWVQGSSMQPALNPDTSLGARDLLALKKYGLRGPSSLSLGDVVVFRSPLEPEKIMVKRIVGLGGELIRPRSTATYPKDEVKIPPNHLWVEGDNIHSIDSNIFGPISSGLLVGKAVCIVYPPSRIGLVPAGGRDPRLI